MQDMGPRMQVHIVLFVWNKASILILPQEDDTILALVAKTFLSSVSSVELCSTYSSMFNYGWVCFGCSYEYQLCK